MGLVSSPPTMPDEDNKAQSNQANLNPQDQDVTSPASSQTSPPDETPGGGSPASAPPILETASTPSPTAAAPPPADSPATSTSGGPAPFVTTPTKNPEGKFGGKKGRRLIATILAVLFLVGGVATGVFLVQQQQIIRIGAWDCKNYVFEVSQQGVVTAINGSTRNEPLQKADVFIDGQLVATCDVPALAAGDAAQICTVTVPSSGNFSWEVVGTKDCEDSGSHRATPTPSPSPTPTPPPTPTEGPTPTASPSPTPSPTPTVTPTPPPIGAACLDVKVYDTNWVLLSSSELSKLAPGDVVRFAVAGTTTSGGFDKTRFTINGTLRPEVTAQKPASDEFYDEYTIPDGVTDFTVSAEIHHTSLGWF